MAEARRSTADGWLTPDRLKPWALFFALTFTFRMGCDIWGHTRFGLVNWHGEQLGRDFVNAWAGPRMALQGHVADAYNYYKLNAFERHLVAPNAESKFYSYPPVNLLFTGVLALFPFIVGYFAWTLGGVAIVTAMLARRLGWGWAAIAVLATPAEYINAYAGQNGAYTAAILAGGIMLLDRRPIIAGLVLGLMCYKPHLALLLPVALAAGMRWRTFVATGVSAVALVTFSILLLGWEPWVAFFQNAAYQQHLLQDQALNWWREPTIYTEARIRGLNHLSAYGLQGISALLAAIAVAVVWRGDANTRVKGAALLVATFLATPYAWDYDMVVLDFAIVWLWQAAAVSRWQNWERFAMTGLWFGTGAISAGVVYTLRLGTIPIFSWLLLLFIIRRAVTLSGPRPAPTSLR